METTRNRGINARESAGGCSEAMLKAKDRAVTQQQYT